MAGEDVQAGEDAPVMDDLCWYCGEHPFSIESDDQLCEGCEDALAERQAQVRYEAGWAL